MAVVRGTGVARIGSVDEFVESREDLGGLRSAHIEEAAPNIGGREAAGRETRDDAKVIEAAFEGAP